MKHEFMNRIFSTLVYIALAVVCLLFVSWIGKMSYDNTCVELQEEYIGIHAREEISKIETSLDFGKEIDNYYGMGSILNTICNSVDAKLYAVVIDDEGTPIYTSMQKSAENVGVLAKVFDEKYNAKVRDVREVNPSGTKIQVGKMESFVFPIYHGDNNLVAHMILLVDRDALVALGDTGGDGRTAQDTVTLFYAIVFCLIIIGIKTLVDARPGLSQAIARRIMMFVILAGMLGYILYMYFSFTSMQSDMISDNARSTAEYVKQSIDELQSKGLLLDNLDDVSNYINNMVSANQSIDNIAVARNYYDTETASSMISLPLQSSNTYVNVSISKEYTNRKLTDMKLIFGSVFVIFMMITYELTKIGELIANRTTKALKTTDPGNVETQIKLLSFMAYTAIYTSMPYAAVIMRNWKATVFGFSEGVSASLPLTIELLCVLITSVIIQKEFSTEKVSRLTYIVFPILCLCNLACARVDSPYMLIALRAIHGVGFAFLKYWLNSYVAAGSVTDRDVQRNYGEMNAGMLCGITVGASLGSIMASAKGYQFNYMFTTALCVAVFVIAITLMPWGAIDSRRVLSSASANKVTMPITTLFKNRNVLKALVLGDVPLNIGLMYVVSFLPVYMSSVGLPAVVSSYAYLINGIAGVYIGVILIRVLRRWSTFIGSFVSLLLGAVGMLVLVLGDGAGVVLVSAALLGLFDGYGTPTITSYFTSIPGTEEFDKAGLLTIFSSVGSAVQIVCPVLYNIIIQPSGEKTYLMIFGICFAAVAVCFYISLIGNEKKRGETEV